MACISRGGSCALALAALLVAGELAAAPYHEELVPSRHARRPVRVLITTPPSYASEPDRDYPVFYFLHDGRGDEEALYRYGIAERLLDEMRSGRLPELILVSPAGGRSWFADSYDGQNRVARFLDEELVAFVEERYRARRSREGRAVLGISMGGYGAMRWALTHPGRFAAAGGLSPAVQQLAWRTVQELPFTIRPIFTRVFGRDEIENNMRENDLYQTLLSRPELARGAADVLIRCGEDDRYRLGQLARFFGQFLQAMGIASEVVVEPGAHEWTYWRESLPRLIHALCAQMGLVV